MSNYSESHFLALQDHIAEGSKKVLSVEQQEYMDLLYATVGMVRKYGRENTISWLIKERDCSRHVAQRIYEEAINLFYADDKVTQDAGRNLLFQKLMEAAHVMEGQFFLEPDEEENPDENRKKPTAKDYEAYAKLIGQAAKIKRLDQADPMPRMAIQNNQVNYYGSNPGDAQMPDTNRQVIAAEVEKFLEQKGIGKSIRDGLMMDLGVMPLNVDIVLDRSIEAAKEVEE